MFFHIGAMRYPKSQVKNGLDLSIQVTRNADGSGEVSYFYENHTSEPLGCSTRDIVDTWIDYLYEGGYHKVTGFKGTVSFPASGTSGVEQVRPGDVYSGVKELPRDAAPIGAVPVLRERHRLGRVLCGEWRGSYIRIADALPYKKSSDIQVHSFRRSDRKKSPGSGLFSFAYFSQFSRSRASSSSKRAGRGPFACGGRRSTGGNSGARDLQGRRAPCLQFPPGQGGGRMSTPSPARPPRSGRWS